MELRDFIRSALHPTRIGAFLVLVLHQKRNVILNRGQLRNVVSQAALGQRFADLLGQKIGDLVRP